MKLLKWILANKITSLIITISLTGVILLSVSTVKVIQVVNGIKTEQSSTTTTESVAESSTETTTVATTSETTTESTTESTTVTTTKPKTTTTTKAPDPKITSSNVKEVFIPLIRHYTSLEQNWHFAIGIDYTKNHVDKIPDSWYEQTGFTEFGVNGMYKFKNVSTKTQLISRYKKYLSSSIVDAADLGNNDMIISIDNELYWIEGARGSYEYDADSIEYRGKQDGGYVVAIDKFLGNGAYLSTEAFLVQYLNGSFKIVQKLGGEILHPNAYENPNYDSILNY